MSRATAWLLALLAIAATGTAIAAVHTKYVERLRFAELQELRARRDALDVEWNRLRLEEAALSTHVLVERKARDELGMYLPRVEDVLLIEEAGHGLR
jgi:cell division protein FtsL